MDFWKKTIRGIGHCSIFGIGLLGLHIVHKRHLSDYFKIVSYAATCAGLYMLTSYLLEEKYEDDDDDDVDVDETKKEGTGRITAQSVMEDLKPALEKQIAVSTKSKPSLEEREMRLLKELEENCTKTVKQSNSEDQTESNENLTSFQHILKDSSFICEFNKMTDYEFVELMKKYNELSDSDKQYVAQNHPVLTCEFNKMTDNEFIELMKKYHELSDSDKEYVAQIHPILTCEFNKMTDNEFVELVKKYNELSDSDKERVAQIHPIFRKFRKLNIKLLKSFKSESAKKAYLEEIGQELKRLGCETVMKGVTDDTIYYTDDSEDEDDSLVESQYENCQTDAESDDSTG